MADEAARLEAERAAQAPPALPQAAADGAPPALPVQPLQPYVYALRERTVRRFFGDSPAYTAEEFKEEVLKAWTPGLSNQRKLEFVTDNVGPLIKAELRCQEQNIQDHAELALDKIVDIFGERRTSRQLLSVLDAVTQSDTETVRALSHRVQDAYRQLVKRQQVLREVPFAQSVLRDQFLSGLRDPTLKKMLQNRADREPELTFGQLREEAIKWADDEIPAAVTSTAVVNSVRHATPASSSRLDRLEDMLQTLTESVAALAQTRATHAPPPPLRDETGRLICYNCQKPGHIARECLTKLSGNQNRPR